MKFAQPRFKQIAVAFTAPLALACPLAAPGLALLATTAAGAEPLENAGPYNARFLAGGIGIERPLPQDAAVLQPGAGFSLSTFVTTPRRQPGHVTLLAVGDAAAGGVRSLGISDGRPVFVIGDKRLTGGVPLAVGTPVHLAGTFDGTVARLYADGRLLATAPMPGTAVAPRIAVAPVIAGAPHFGGALVGARLDAGALATETIAAQAATPPDFAIVQMRDTGVGWPFQVTANIGLVEPQDPWTLPHGKAAFDAPVAKPLPATPDMVEIAPMRWAINGWRLASAPDLGEATGAELSRPGVDTRRWLVATVPGTVLTTLVDRGVYPDPYRGLNNLAIPESLARQDWWYRSTFAVPAGAAGKQLSLTFGGINYAAEIWINGHKSGAVTGAFIRADIPFTAVEGDNIVAVRVSPPPHPGIPHEQSIAAGPGLNGGQMAYDGPTFVATEGWDWIPAMRDRNTGLWQSVTLAARGDLQLGDPHIITDLPLPRIDSADIFVTVPVRNTGTRPLAATIRAKIAGIDVSRSLTVPPGETEVRFAPASDPALRLSHPALWWPNGLGAPTLHDLVVTVEADGAVSDTLRQRFGIRELSYELSLFDAAGALRRVDIQMTDASLAGVRPIDARHAMLKQSPLGWVASLTAAGEASSAVRDVPATMALPHLTLRVNGVRVAMRGGNWGMDDAMKRAGRDRLAPYFRLQKEANLNVIRNWMGNNDQPDFYDLADENGMLILNDFWQSTQNFQVEPGDPALFLANAADTIRRYRNHPSIALWFGRNEGVPAPVLNEGLDDLVARLDGTRWFSGSSNTVNLQGSGPYDYRPPVGYFTDLASGFSVETGTPSLATLEAVEAMTPPADRWPLSDTYAYHDWHFGGNGDTKSFMAALATMFGPATDLADFERKAQMMNLETHKAIYEGFFAHLWSKNSGRLLWMTHPAWPSNMWQIYSSDYDTNAAYYGVKSATEAVHIQLDLPDYRVAVINTTLAAKQGLVATSRVLGLDGKPRFQRTDRLVASANSVTGLAPLPMARLFAADPLLLVELVLSDAQGGVVSRNFYWQAAMPQDVRQLTTLPQQPLTASASARVDRDDTVVTVRLANPGAVPALSAKLTLLDARGNRILPAFYSDNYLALLPGAERLIEIRYPGGVAAAPPQLALRGWNIVPATIAVTR